MLLGVEPLTFSDIAREELCDSDLLAKRIATMYQYTRVCSTGIDIVAPVSDELLNELKSVIYQYFLTFCEPCQDEFRIAAERMVDQPSGISTALTKLNNEYKALQTQLGEAYQNNPRQARPWKDKTIFDIVYAALVILAREEYGLQLGSDFKELKQNNAVKAWLDLTKTLAPHVACFSEEHCALATTYAHWEGWWLLEDWEKQIRSAAIDPAVRKEAGRAQQVLAEVVKTHPDASPQELVRLGSDALERQLDFFRDCGDFGRWWAMSCLTLEHKDQCPSCRCMFRHSQKVQSNSPPKDPLGKNREAGRPCQCAEVALYSLLLECMLQDRLERQRGRGRLAAEEARRFGYSAPKQEEQARQRRWSH